MSALIIGLLLIFISYRLQKKIPSDYYKDPKNRKRSRDAASFWIDD